MSLCIQVSFHCCSVAQLCPTLFDPTDCSMPGFPVLHQLLECAPSHVHCVGDAIQPSRPLPPFSPFASLAALYLDWGPAAGAGCFWEVCSFPPLLLFCCSHGLLHQLVSKFDEFLYLWEFILFLFLGCKLRSLWDFSSLTRDWTRSLSSKNMESQLLDHQGIPSLCIQGDYTLVRSPDLWGACSLAVWLVTILAGVTLAIQPPRPPWGSTWMLPPGILHWLWRQSFLW